MGVSVTRLGLDVGGGRGWHGATVCICMLVAAVTGVSSLYVLTLCGSELCLLVSTEPLEPLHDLSCLTTLGLAIPDMGRCPCC